MQFLSFAVGFISGILATLGIFHSLHRYMSYRVFQSTAEVKREREIVQKTDVISRERSVAGEIN